ncbi:hypothetical protein [Rhodococcoides fascians]|uniref:hypothetical protein n=1 Tax=Rhodococcoides fascians TaxID=1828 RepID=UPI0011AE38E2|nr:hypothetical protein [Rhodococcus fascians]
MRGQWRWLAVVLGIAVLVATPSVIERLPVAASDIGAAELLSRVQSSTATPYSGYAQAVGGVTLPVTDGLGGLPDLLGDTTTLRAWYRAPDSFRVDTVRLAGERGLYRSPALLWRWDYEQNTAVATPVPEPSLRLPREADLLPPELGQRLLSEATTDEVTRLPTAELPAGTPLACGSSPPSRRAPSPRSTCGPTPTAGCHCRSTCSPAGPLGLLSALHSWTSHPRCPTPTPSVSSRPREPMCSSRTASTSPRSPTGSTLPVFRRLCPDWISGTATDRVPSESTAVA